MTESLRMAAYFGYVLLHETHGVVYVGITKNPHMRERSHRSEGKSFRNLKIETSKPMTWDAARRWERKRLDSHRRENGYRNPVYNRTSDGGATRVRPRIRKR